MVGRYLMEHPQFVLAGEVVTDAELDRLWPAANTGQRDARPGRRAGAGGAARPARRRPAVLAQDAGSRRWRASSARRAAGPTSTTRSPSAARCGRPTHNRVVPTAERDAFGLPRLAARCVLDAGDYRNVEDTLRALGETLMRLERGRVRVNNDRIYLQMRRAGPHARHDADGGRTRRRSVVDGDCRVHGYANLFVAGSSVFPSGGYANPTITIVALALRLADRLAGKARRDQHAIVAACRAARSSAIGGSTLLAAAAATAWRWRTSQAEAGRRPRAPTRRSPTPTTRAGWCRRRRSRRCRPGSGEPAGAAALTVDPMTSEPATGHRPAGRRARLRLRRGRAAVYLRTLAPGLTSDLDSPMFQFIGRAARRGAQSRLSALHAGDLADRAGADRRAGLADQRLLRGDGRGRDRARSSWPRAGSRRGRSWPRRPRSASRPARRSGRRR